MRSYSRKILTLCAAVLGVSALPASRAADLVVNFDADLGGAVVNGSAARRDSGGVNDTGYVSITDALNSLQGGLTLPAFDVGGGALGSFTVAFQVRMGGGTARPADGMSFNIVPANDPIVNSNVGEDGPGRGLTVSFDTWDNNPGPDAIVSAPVLEVFYNGASLGNRQSVGTREGNRAPTEPIYTYTDPVSGGTVNFDIFTDGAAPSTPTWQPVVIEYASQPNGTGLLDVSYKGIKMFDDLPVNMPAGSYRVVLGARTGGANAAHWVDEFNITSAAPAFHSVVRTSPMPNADAFGAANLEVDIADGTSGAFNNSSVSATLNGVAIPAGNITFNKVGTVTTITIDPPGDMARSSNQTLALTYGNGIGADTSVLNLPFLVSPMTPDTLFVETEDIDFDAGQFLPESQNPDYPGGAYLTGGPQAAGLPLINTDYWRPNGDGNNEYRLGEEPNIGMAANGDVVRLPGFSRTANWKLGWNDNGEWNNYTRDFAEAGNNYEIWARLASGGTDMAAKLSIVQNNQLETQVLGDIGTFNAPPTGGWDNFVLVPLRRGGEIASTVLKGRQVIRFTTLPGNNDNNYLAFIPTGPVPTPAIVNLTPNNGISGRGTVNFTASIIEQTDTIDPSTVSLLIGGQVIAEGTAVKGGQVITITGVFDNFGYFNTRVGTVRFTQGATVRNVDVTLTSGGGVTYRRFDGINGGAAVEVRNAPGFINNSPNLVMEIPRFEKNDSAAAVVDGGFGGNIDNFGGQLLAYFRPPETGGYQFNISADDGAELWLSTDDKPYNRVLIARQPAWSGYRAFNTQADQAAGSTPPERISPMIQLTAGNRYYIEGIYHEGGGGDNIAVTYRRDTATPWVNGVPGLSEVEPFVGADFSQVPQAQTALVGRRVQFSATLVAEQGGAITWQWYRGTDPIVGEVGPSYVIPAVAASDDGAMISVRATLNGIEYSTTPVRLTVNADAVAPTITEVVTKNFHELLVRFSEGVQGPLGVENFTLNNGMTIVSVDFDAGNPGSAFLTVEGATPGAGLVENTTYTLTPVNILDLAGNAATGTASITPVYSERFASAWKFNGIGGVAVSEVVNHPKFQSAPDEIYYNSEFGHGADFIGIPNGGIWENYGMSVHGFFKAPRTGGVIWFISADDNAEFWVSTDENPANKVLVAREPVWNGARQWLVTDRRGERQNVSGLIDVVEGNRYYLELLFHEGGGGDNGGATYIYGDATEDPPNGSPALNGTALGVVVNGAGRSITFTTPVTSGPIVQGRSTTLTGAVSVTPEGSTIGYQWSVKRAGDADFVDIAGANTATLNVGPLNLPEDDNIQYRLVAFTLGAQASSTVTIDVTPDATAPTATGASALRFHNDADVGITFNEPVDPTSAQTVANYTTSAGTVQSVQYFPANNAVAVRVSGLTVGQNYTVTVRGVTDPYGNAIPAAGQTLPFTLGAMSWAGVGADDLNIQEGVVAIGADGFDAISGGSTQWTTYDESTFIYEQITGDFDKRVRVAFQESSSQWARTGLMVREELNEGKPALVAGEDPATDGFSRYQKVHVNPVFTAMGTAGNNSHELNRRMTRGVDTDGAPISNNAAPQYPNAWVRLKREGDILTMFRSNDGNEWVQLGTTTMTGLAATAFVGPDYAPELNNITAGPLRRAYLAQFREYGNVSNVPPLDIAIAKTATGARITWSDAGAKLYRSDALGAAANWVEVVGATSPHDTSTAGFYRTGRAQ